MTTDKYTTMNIRLSQEERGILENALDVLRKLNGEIDNCNDVDEIRLSDCIDANLLSDIETELNELGCSVKF